MTQAISIAALLMSSIVLATYTYRRWTVAQLVRDRLFATEEEREAPVEQVRSVLRRYRWIPWTVAAGIAATIYWLVNWPLVISFTIGLIVGLLGGQIEAYLHSRHIAKLEAQLADSLDLMVGALSAGAGAMVSLTAAANETPKPLRPLLDDALARIRLGDDAQLVFGNMSQRVPEETFLLFATTLAVHWEVGGSLAPTLATLGRTIRDRIEVSRRIRSNIIQSQASTVLIVVITYFIALLMWNHDPGSVLAFVKSTVGLWLVAITMLLQAIGIVWMAAMSKMKF